MTRTASAALLVVALGAALLGTGCTNRVADLTLVSTRNIDLSNTTLDVRQGKRVKGEDCQYAILGLIPTSGYPNLENAIDRALTSGGGNVLVDQVTYAKALYVVLFSRVCLEVEGTALNASAVE